MGCDNIAFARGGVSSKSIILIIKAVIFHGVLRGVDGDGDAFQRQILIVVAGGGLHHALDVIYLALCVFAQITDEIFNCDLCFCSIGCLCYNIEVDHIQQAHAVLSNRGSLHLAVGDAVLIDLCFPLQGQIALVGNAETLGQVTAARLPKDLLSCIIISGASFGEVQRFDMRIAVRTDNIHLQITGNDLIHAGRCGVGEPCEGGAHQHCKADEQRGEAHEQCCLFAFCFHVLLLFVLV